jgi:hypothetical protein
MFVWACASQQACRQIKDRFELSLDTICRKMSEVGDVMFSFVETIIAPKDPTYKKVNHRLNRFAPYLDGCIGALDGTHVPVQINRESREDFINRKGYTSFNVLGIVDMNMRFTFVGAGRAGSSHDMSVLRNCMEFPNYPHPPPGMLTLYLRSICKCGNRVLTNGGYDFCVQEGTIRWTQDMQFRLYIWSYIAIKGTIFKNSSTKGLKLCRRSLTTTIRVFTMLWNRHLVCSSRGGTFCGGYRTMRGRSRSRSLLLALRSTHFCWRLDLQELHMGTWFEMRTTKYPYGWQQMLLRIWQMCKIL